MKRLIKAPSTFKDLQNDSKVAFGHKVGPEGQPLSQMTLGFLYSDEEGCEISISNNDDLLVAIEVARVSFNGNLRLKVKAIPKQGSGNNPKPDKSNHDAKTTAENITDLVSSLVGLLGQPKASTGPKSVKSFDPREHKGPKPN